MTSDDKRRYWGVVPPIAANEIAALAQQAEAMGLQGLFAIQVWGPPWIPLAAAAVATEKIELASAIAIASARSPFETAMAAIDLDRVSGGRFTLGLGASVFSISRGLFGAPEHKPVAHLRETVAAVRHIIRGAHRGLEPFEGRWYQADFAELQPTEPPLREEIPIWIAGLRGPLVRLAAEVADGVMGHGIWSVDWAVRQVEEEVAAGLKRANRRREDLHVHVGLFVAVNPDVAEAIEDARPTVAFYAGIQQYESFFEAHGFGEEARRMQEHMKQRNVLESAHLVPDEMVRTFVQCGRPDEVRERVERVWGVADSMCLLAPFWALSPEKIAFYQEQVAKTFYV